MRSDLAQSVSGRAEDRWSDRFGAAVRPAGPLDGLTTTANETAGLAVDTCAEHLALLGARRRVRLGSVPSRHTAGELSVRLTDHGPEVTCGIEWLQPDTCEPHLEGEAIIQAITGLMGLHGRQRQRPRRLGLEVASVGAGIVAAQGVLAAALARSRGLEIRAVETSVLQAGLLFLGHHLAIATCADQPPFPGPGDGCGPPFRSADGHWVEIESLTFESWVRFWRCLGVDDGTPETAWLAFVHRYLAATCSVPATLHTAAASRSLAELRQVGDACSVAVVRVRSYAELLADGGPGSDHARTLSETSASAPWVIAPGPRGPVVRRNHARGRPPVAPLAGFRVVEATSRLQGPLAGLLLQQLGAEVIKVEPPGGDFGRFGPPRAGTLGAAYVAYNRGKRTVEVDYKRPEGRADLLDLAAQADVFLHNWRAGRAEALGLDSQHLLAVNPKLVYAFASGWGAAVDPPCPIAGDYLVQAHAACGDGLNPVGQPALPSRLTLVDLTGGLIACEGILAGLYLRERTQWGCRVDTSLIGGAMALQEHVLRALARGREEGRCLGRPVWGLLDEPLATAMGYLVVIAEDERTRSTLGIVCELAGTWDEAALRKRLLDRPASEWASLLVAAGVPAAVVRMDLARLPDDPCVAALLEDVDGACWVPGAPWRFKT
jgi:CoA:oxalate CoA-transferase